MEVISQGFVLSLVFLQLAIGEKKIDHWIVAVETRMDLDEWIISIFDWSWKAMGQKWGWFNYHQFFLVRFFEWWNWLSQRVIHVVFWCLESLRWLASCFQVATKMTWIDRLLWPFHGISPSRSGEKIGKRMETQEHVDIIWYTLL